VLPARRRASLEMDDFRPAKVASQVALIRGTSSVEFPAQPYQVILSMITVRPAAEYEAEVLSRLAIETYVTAFGHSFEPSNLAAHLDSNLSSACFEDILKRDVVLVASRKTEAVGFLQFGRQEGSATEGSDAWEIRRVYVHERLQNAGLGRMLMEHALSRPELSGAKDIYLDVWEDNLAAQRFYARFDFSPICKREFRVASGQVTGSDLIMHRLQ
jgi:diamine N-acetyltransferase